MPTTHYIYILSNQSKTLLTVGVTEDLDRSVEEQRRRMSGDSNPKNRTTKLVYYEAIDLEADALAREKEIKKGSLKKKIELVETMNREWKDLWA